MAGWTLLDREGIRLALRDFGGMGPALLLLHGLAGHAEEWRDTAAWLATDHHVFALDMRGHGRSERRPQDLSHQALVDDAAAAIEHIGEPVILIGQSLGGIAALLLSAWHPNLVRALVVMEASPRGMDEGGVMSLADDIDKKLGGWPVPFGTRDDAIAFFGGHSVAATAWTEGLEQREDGLWPRFDIDVMVRMLRTTAGDSHWDAWERIRRPILIVRGQNGSLTASDTKAMVERLPSARSVTVGDAGHDVHLDRPDAWRRTLETFLTELE